MELLGTGLSLGHYLALGAALFCISVAGIFLNRKNVIVLLMCIELLLLAVNINFVAFSRELGDPAGQVFVFFILTVAVIAAVMLTLRRRPGAKHQNPSEQGRVKAADRMRLVQMQAERPVAPATPTEGKEAK